MPELIGRIESTSQLLAIAFSAYIADPSAHNYKRMENAMIAYQHSIYGDRTSASI